MVSAGGISATGTSFPYDHLEYRWDFGEPAGAEIYTDPRSGRTKNINIQYGPEAVYTYRTAGTYTITLRARGLTSGGAFIDYTTTEIVTVTAFDVSGGEYWFDSVAGSDANDGLDISRPKQTISALNALITSNCRINLKRGSHWIVAAGIEMPDAIVTGFRLQAYGTGAKPIVEVNTGSDNCFGMNNGNASSNYSKRDTFISGIILSQTANHNAVKTSGSSVNGVIDDTYFDDCEFRITYGSGISSISCDFNKDLRSTSSRMGFTGCTFYATPTAGLGTKHGFFGGSNIWFHCLGCDFTGGGTSVGGLDHHMYLETREHLLLVMNDFGDGPGRNYAANINLRKSVTEPTLQYGQWFNLRENRVSGTWRGFDCSETHGDIAIGRFKNFVVERNNFTGITGDGVLLFYSAETYTLRGNRTWGCNGGRFFAPQSTMATILQSFVYENWDFVTTGLGQIYYQVAFSLPQQITRNVIHDTRTTASTIRVDYASSGSSLIDRNQIYAPNDTTPLYNGGTAQSWAQWQAQGFDLNGSTTDPNWIDPANGVFDVPVGRVRFGAV